MGLLTQADKDQINREILRLAITRNIFCSECDSILDLRKSVLLLTPKAPGGKSALACGQCFDAHITQEFGVAPTAEMWAETECELIDGRELS